MSIYSSTRICKQSDFRPRCSKRSARKASSSTKRTEPDGSKEYLNKRWYEYTGLSLEEGKGWGWKVVVHPDDLDRLVREWLALVDARKPGALETRIRRYDGEYRWFLIRIAFPSLTLKAT